MEQVINGEQDWQERLLKERFDLLQKTMKLKKVLDDPDMKLNRKEWDMLSRQSFFMTDYLQVLTERCAYYGLIESCDLGLKYPNGVVKG